MAYSESPHSVDSFPTSADDCVDAFTDGVSHPLISRYFQTLNAHDFEVAAELFAEDGSLQPPFEGLITGREAIATYLREEARGMQLQPQKEEVEQMESGDLCSQVYGRVQTPRFGVRVRWTFVITPQESLRLVRIKLLASPLKLVQFAPQ